MFRSSCRRASSPAWCSTPQQGVSFDRRGRPTALVVNAENVVEPRELEIIAARGSDWIVSSGLATGDRIVVEGVQKAPPGATVIPEERGAASGATGVPEAPGPTDADAG